MFTRRLFLSVMVVLVACAQSVFAGDEVRERWFVLEMMGERSGWMHATVAKNEEQIVSTDRMLIELNRAGQTIKLIIETTFTETPDGKPISTSVSKSFGGPTTVTTYTFRDYGVHEKTVADGRVTENTHPPIEGVWLTPRAADLYLAKRLAARADKITVRTIDATTQLQPLMMTYTDFEPTTLELLGRTVKAVRCKVVNSLTPTMSSVEYIDDRGEVLQSETDFGGMTIKMMAADKDLAMSDIDAPEMMTELFIKPDRDIPGARTLKGATYLLTVPDGEIADVPTTGSQRMERIDDRTIRVHVDAQTFTPAGKVDIASFTESTSMLDTRDEVVIDLVKRALDGVTEDPVKRAEVLRRFVYRHVRTKSLGVGFASASEVARSCEGDCTEHGTLLAAMLRVDGIPSRVVSGLVYVDSFAGAESVFGYHMWTQALLTIEGEPRWVDLDATLPGSLDYDATHIALGMSALRDGETINGLLQIAPLMGRLQIAVESLD